jgi:hypothetical protein
MRSEKVPTKKRRGPGVDKAVSHPWKEGRVEGRATQRGRDSPETPQVVELQRKRSLKKILGYFPDFWGASL